MKRISIVFYILIAFQSSSVFAEGIYKWTDDNGQIHYGSKPPENEQSATVVNMRKKSVNTIPVTSDERKRKQQNLLRALIEERQIKEEAKAENDKKEAQQKRQCIMARDRLKSYERSSRIYNLNEKGERVFMSDKDRDRSVAEFKRKVNEWCN